MTVAVLLALAAPVAPVCAEGGRTTMDPRLEFAQRIRTRIPVREPRPALVAARERAR